MPQLAACVPRWQLAWCSWPREAKPMCSVVLTRLTSTILTISH